MTLNLAIDLKCLRITTPRKEAAPHRAYVSPHLSDKRRRPEINHFVLKCVFVIRGDHHACDGCVVSQCNRNAKSHTIAREQ